MPLKFNFTPNTKVGVLVFNYYNKDLGSTVLGAIGYRLLIR